MKKIGIILCLMSTSLSAAVYRWTDENGVEHFSTSQPPNQVVEEINPQVNIMQSYQGDSSKSQRSGSSDSGAPRQLSAGTQQALNGLAAGILADHGDAEELDCRAAVENAKSGIDTMLDVGKTNYEDGYMTKDVYETMAKKLRAARSEFSFSKCQVSKGKERAFYLCMSNDYNHVATCMNKAKDAPG